MTDGQEWSDHFAGKRPEPDGVLDGQVVVTRIVEPTDVLIAVDPGDLPVLDAVGMLTMAIDSLLHPEIEGQE